MNSENAIIGTSQYFIRAYWGNPEATLRARDMMDHVSVQYYEPERVVSDFPSFSSSQEQTLYGFTSKNKMAALWQATCLTLHYAESLTFTMPPQAVLCGLHCHDKMFV